MSREENKYIPKWKHPKINKNVGDWLGEVSLEMKLSKEIENQKNIFLDILEIIDDIERALKNNGSTQNDQKYLVIIRKKLLKLLEKNGIIQMYFDDNKAKFGWCEVIGAEKKEGLEDDIIIREVKKGYLWKDKVLRLANIIIVKNER